MARCEYIGDDWLEQALQHVEHYLGPFFVVGQHILVADIFLMHSIWKHRSRNECDYLSRP